MQGLEEDTEIIGENFTMHFTKYAKRSIINELSRNYIKGSEKQSGEEEEAGEQRLHPGDGGGDHLPHCYLHHHSHHQEWVINMPSMLDARVSLSLMDVVRGENQFDEDFEWVEADEVSIF